VVRTLFSALQLPTDKVFVCDNNRPLKIKALRKIGFEYAVAAIKGKITDGISTLKDLKVYYTDDSPNLKHEQEMYSYKVDRYGVVLEEPEDKNNHLMDCARYGAEFMR